ncbi:cytochrome b [Stutzerimonas azotifigens]|uniref:cytochrome b n=1 Tax=Stutzerimonas azotifigens TaxID=291995 RepID=UPI0003FA0287|nr:cytochrome b/b6 domain-containing protein [Stutzerimonas azotifigens]
MQLKDSADRYGTVSRALHWGMALLIAWQFATAIARVLAKDSALDEFLWATHKPLGALLMLLVLVRGLWSLANAGHRPRSLSLMARLGHLAMYALIVVVPLLALLRQYGSGRAFSPFGVPLMGGFDGEIKGLMAPANLLHGWLGWLLLVLIVGHIVMTIVHRRRPNDEDVLARMIGNR